MADDLSRSHPRICAAAGNASHNRGPTRGRRVALGHAQLRYLFWEVHVEAARRLGPDVFSDAQGRGPASVTAPADSTLFATTIIARLINIIRNYDYISMI